MFKRKIYQKIRFSNLNLVIAHLYGLYGCLMNNKINSLHETLLNSSMRIKRQTWISRHT